MRRQCMIYGAGLTGMSARIYLEGNLEYECVGFIDDASSKIGTVVSGIRVIGLREAVSAGKEKDVEIIIASEQYWFDLENNLRKNNYSNYSIYRAFAYLEVAGTPDIEKIDNSLATAAEGVLEDEYSKIIFKNILEHRKLGKKDYVSYPYQYFSHYVPGEKDIIFDCGAAYGWFTQRCLSHLKNGRIYAFEPDPELFARLTSIYAGNDLVIPVKSGVFSRCGLVSFNIDGGHGTGYIGSGGPFEIDVTDLDTFASSNGVGKIDFIKMDIEGSEIDAIKGARETIIKCKPALAICVYHKRADIWEIPLIIKELRGDYRLFLDHHSVTMGETVLYAL